MSRAGEDFRTGEYNGERVWRGTGEAGAVLRQSGERGGDLRNGKKGSRSLCMEMEGTDSGKGDCHVGRIISFELSFDIETVSFVHLIYSTYRR
jgi:hypothetical protein